MAEETRNRELPVGESHGFSRGRRSTADPLVSLSDGTHEEPAEYGLDAKHDGRKIPRLVSERLSTSRSDTRIMWPWAHAAVGYLLYVGWIRGTDHFVRDIHGLPLFTVVLGTQMPDLIDKPLAWTFALLPAGRSFAHSVFGAVLISVIALYLSFRGHRPISGWAFTLGYWSHLLADGFWAIVTHDFGDLRYLFWPLLSLPEYETAQSFMAHLRNFTFDLSTLFGFALVGVALAVAADIEYGRDTGRF